MKMYCSFHLRMMQEIVIVLRTKLCNNVAIMDMTVQLCNKCDRFLAKPHSQENYPAASLKMESDLFS